MKNFKIKVVIGGSEEAVRNKMAQLIVCAGLAAIRSDGLKLIKRFPEDVLPVEREYAVFVANYDFSMNLELTIKLISMAAAGLLVILGAKKVPKQLEGLVERVYC